MEAIERDIRIGNGTKKMQEISKIFNKSSSISEFKIKLSLDGFDFDKVEKEYTRLVAKNGQSFWRCSNIQAKMPSASSDTWMLGPKLMR